MKDKRFHIDIDATKWDLARNVTEPIQFHPVHGWSKSTVAI
jgi:hypothetical protein